MTWDLAHVLERTYMHGPIITIIDKIIEVHHAQQNYYIPFG